MGTGITTTPLPFLVLLSFSFPYISLLPIIPSYERKAIEEWITRARENGLPITSPTTTIALDHCYLTTNIAIKNLIDEYRCGLGIPPVVEELSGPDTTPSRNSPAKKQQRVASPAQQVPPLFVDNSTSEVERVEIMIDQQLAEIQSMIWKLPSASKTVSPVLATSPPPTASPSPSPSAVIIPPKPSIAVAVVTPKKTTTKESTKENTNDAWTTVVQSKKTTTAPIPIVVPTVTNGPGPKPSTSKKGSTSGTVCSFYVTLPCSICFVTTITILIWS